MTAEDRRISIRNALRKRRGQLKAEGKCVDCGKLKHRETGTLCQECIDGRRERHETARLRLQAARKILAAEAHTARVEKMMRLACGVVSRPVAARVAA